MRTATGSIMSSKLCLTSSRTWKNKELGVPYREEVFIKKTGTVARNNFPHLPRRREEEK